MLLHEAQRPVGRESLPKVHGGPGETRLRSINLYHFLENFILKFEGRNGSSYWTQLVIQHMLSPAWTRAIANRTLGPWFLLHLEFMN